MMRIAFNARLLHDGRIRGWNRYTIDLLAELPALGAELFLYAEKPVDPSYLERLPRGGYTIRQSPPRLPYPVWEQAWLPLQCARDRIDVFHSPFNFGLPWKSRCPRVLTLHDAIDQVYYEPLTPWREKLRRRALETRFYHWGARKHADRIITVSRFSKSDLVQHLGLDPERIEVIHEAADPRFSATLPAEESQRVRAHYQLERPYVFYVGGWEKRKNLPFLLSAFGRAHLPGIELVLAGAGSDAERRALAALAREHGFPDRLRLLGPVEDRDLPALYANALCFVYPSEYEGFGLQLCEAMATGCPTFASAATCLPEILGIGGETFPLDEPGPLARLLERLVQDASWRADLSHRARLRSRDFSWRRTAEATFAVYRSLAR